jgi:hypothetical protein
VMGSGRFVFYVPGRCVPRPSSSLRARQMSSSAGVYFRITSLPIWVRVGDSTTQ